MNRSLAPLLAALLVLAASPVTGLAQEPSQTLVGHDRALLGLAFSPDGTRLASVSGDETLRVWDLGTGKTIFTAKGTAPNENRVVFTPDGSGVFGLAERGVRRYDAATGATVRDYTLEVSGGPTAYALSPDGTTLAVVGRAALAFFRVDTGAILGPHEVHPQYGVFGVAFSPDGTRVATASSDHTVAVVEVATGKVERSIDLGTHVMRVAWSVDGKTVFASREMSCNTLVAIDPAAGAVTVLDDEGLPKLDLAPSADGRWVLVAGNAHQPRVWSIAEKAWTPKALKEHMSQVRAVAISRDGKWIASGDHEGKIHLYASTAATQGK